MKRLVDWYIRVVYQQLIYWRECLTGVSLVYQFTDISWSRQQENAESLVRGVCSLEKKGNMNYFPTLDATE